MVGVPVRNAPPLSLKGSVFATSTVEKPMVVWFIEPSLVDWEA